MSDHLWPMLRLKADSGEELKEEYRRVYIEEYVSDSDGNDIEIYDWQGKRVIFHAPSFDHAFSESSSYKKSYGLHDISLSLPRVYRMLWIKEVLACSAGTIERRQEIRRNKRGQEKKRRTFIVLEEQYVVVLEETSNHQAFNFISAFPADRSYLEKIQRESVLIEIKKPQSFGD